MIGNALADARRPARHSLERLRQLAEAGAERWPALDLDTRIDETREFIAPELTPLFYTESFSSLTPPQALRYNQLMGIASSEVIHYFEEVFTGNVLPALLRRGDLPAPLAACLRAFLAEEERHMGMWRALLGWSDPHRPEGSRYRYAGVSRTAHRVLAAVCARPERFPFVFWVVLAQEELSIHAARRCAAMERGRLEPHFAAAYRAHVVDEARHVQLDWHLIERFYAPLPALWRRANAAVLRFLFRQFLISPRRAAARVVRTLALEHPELAPLLPRMVGELRRLGANRRYQAALYSRRSHPITFALFDRFPEMRRMTRVLSSYTPDEGGGTL